ncbi:MAG: SIS domain-containing protein [Planctomycetota bacterium]|jgi:6-phospho-3-hexuloisomerase|nr:SIS domain-containing protein [Planctomycetota bacterium]
MNAVQYALAEFDVIRRQAAGVDPAACEKFVDELQAAKRIFVGGAGRSLLSMKMFAMRLMQTNHAVFLVGGACTPGIGPGDMLAVGSGKGGTSATLELVRKARRNGARAALITGNPAGSIAAEADVVLTIPPPAEVDGEDATETVFMKRNLPGNFFEIACIVVGDGLIARIMERKGLGGSVIMRNHANLE